MTLKYLHFYEGKLSHNNFEVGLSKIRQNIIDLNQNITKVLLEEIRPIKSFSKFLKKFKI